MHQFCVKLYKGPAVFGETLTGFLFEALGHAWVLKHGVLVTRWLRGAPVWDRERHKVR